MTQRYDTTQTVDKVKPTSRELVGLKMEAFLTATAAAGVIVGAAVLASEYHETRLLWLGVISVPLAIRARWLWSETHNGPALARRLWWRAIAWRNARAMRPRPSPKPYRAVRVAGQDEAVRIPRQPGEMARETEPVIVAGLTASDVYWIACRAYMIGLDERSWRLADETVLLPSGRQLSRSAFRQVQAWLVERGMADKHPRYHLAATPEAVLENLK